jgi:hypothetical protein
MFSHFQGQGVRSPYFSGARVTTLPEMNCLSKLLAARHLIDLIPFFDCSYSRPDPQQMMRHPSEPPNGGQWRKELPRSALHPQEPLSSSDAQATLRPSRELYSSTLHFSTVGIATLAPIGRRRIFKVHVRLFSEYNKYFAHRQSQCCAIYEPKGPQSVRVRTYTRVTGEVVLRRV